MEHGRKATWNMEDHQHGKLKINSMHGTWKIRNMEHHLASLEFEIVVHTQSRTPKVLVLLSYQDPFQNFSSDYTDGKIALCVPTEIVGKPSMLTPIKYAFEVCGHDVAQL